MNQKPKPLMGGPAATVNKAEGPKQTFNSTARTTTVAKPANKKVTPFNPNELLSTNLNNVLSQGSPLMDHARSGARKQSAERGLQNTSAAVAAGESAVISQGLQIAQGDAQAYQGLGNRQHDLDKQTYQNDHETKLQNDQMSWQSNESLMEREHKTALQEGQQEWQSNESLMDRDHKTQLQEGQQQWQSDENLANRDHTSAENLANREHATSENLLNREHASAEKVKDREHQSSENVLNREHDKAVVELQGQIQEKRDAILHSNNMAAISEQGRVSLENALSQMERQHANNMASIDAQADANSKLQYQNQSGNVLMTGMDQIGQIYSNPNMTPEQQAAGVATVQAQIKGQMDDLGFIYGNTGEGPAIGPNTPSQGPATPGNGSATAPVYSGVPTQTEGGNPHEPTFAGESTSGGSSSYSDWLSGINKRYDEPYR